jgi:hypothetical protein
MRRFLVQAGVPRHEIWEWFDFPWWFHQTYAIEWPNDLRQLPRRSQHQVGVPDCEYCRRKKWNAEGNMPLRTELSQRTVHRSLLARPRLDRYMRKL